MISPSSPSSRAERRAERAALRARSAAYYAADPDSAKDRAADYRARRSAVTVAPVSRSFIWTRDAGVCYLCGLAADHTLWHLDHVVPLIRGGAHASGNVAVTHAACNLSKGAKPWDRVRLYP